MGELMRASGFEFQHRFAVIVLIFLLAFGWYSVQPVNAVEWFLKAMGSPGRAAGIYPTTSAAHIIFAVGAALVGAAAWIRTWGTAYLRNEVVRDSVVHAERLVADGPYRCVRNPLYLGDILLAAGLAPMTPPVGCVVLIAGMVIAMLRLIGREEAFLLEKQGDAYRAYLERVPRLWPSLRPRLPAGGAKARWGQAWVGEISMWFLFAGSAAFAITINPMVFEFMVAGGFILRGAVQVSMKRRLERRSV
jgi:protein-S-isoprenylcysteine O-methyltransferase Ste14